MSHPPETRATIASRPQLSHLASELAGTALLIVAVVGSGIMAESLSDDVGIQLLANAGATVGALYALITMFGTISGAHFNPVVSLMAAARGQLSWASLPLYSFAQLVGGCLGTALANMMFEQPAWEWSTKLRDGSGIWLGEVVATAGLLLVIALTTAARPTSTPSVVAAWIGGAYWFTSSTSLANPAVTAARSLSNSFAGIAPESVPMFWLMQMVGTALAFGLLVVLGKWRQ